MVAIQVLHPERHLEPDVPAVRHSESRLLFRFRVSAAYGMSEIFEMCTTVIYVISFCEQSDG